jgi:hypothetical protein
MEENRYFNAADKNIYCGMKCTTDKENLSIVGKYGANLKDHAKNSSHNERMDYQSKGYSFKGPEFYGPPRYGAYYIGTPDPANTSVWEKVLTAFNSPTKKSTDVDNLFKCCNGQVVSKADQNACGSLLYLPGDKTKSKACLTNMREYCSVPANMPSTKCLTQISNDIKSGYEQENNIYNLDAVCKDKKPGTVWDNLCACNYSFDFYDNINKKISGEWNIPNEYISPLPECMYPRCAASNLRNLEVKCPTSSFTQCIQNNNLDITDSTISNIAIKQTGDCIKYTRKNEKEKKEFNEENADDKDDKDSSFTETMSENKYMIFLFIFLVFVCMAIGIAVSFGSKPKNKVVHQV